MSPINTEDVWMLGFVSIIACYRLSYYAQCVGNVRRKYKVEPPSVDGPDEFQRTFRAQQNVLEFTPLFLICLWVSGLFFHQLPAAIVGLVYVYAREQYFNGYCESAKGRIAGFYLSVRCLYIFLAMSVLGVIYCAIPFFN